LIDAKGKLTEPLALIPAGFDKSPAGADLSEEVFLLASRLTPLVNVDLLIQDTQGRTLLTWRYDQWFGPGWHFPGGIIRLGETAATRILAVARLELGTTVVFNDEPVQVVELIDPHQTDRSHHISLLYRCRISGCLPESGQYRSGPPRPGQWAWHVDAPVNLLSEQQAYVRYFKRFRRPSLFRSLTAHIPSQQWLRYLLVGVWNTVFAYASFALLTYWLTPLMPASYMVASLLSSFLNITVSFLGYKWWVFKTKGHYLREWLKALMVYSGSIAIGLALLPPTVYAITRLTHDPVKAPYIAGALLMGFNVLISFFGHRQFTFKVPKQPSGLG
jgi:putative flippase GtrA/ADP-ribose pyrophosphatase YjhB (NUDIX family)